MAWSRSRCLARSLTRPSRHGRRRARGLVRSSAAFAPCRRPRSPTPSSFCMPSPRCWARSSTSYFRVDMRPELERAGHWQVLGFFDLKEHFVAIGLALLPAYWVCWRQPRADEPVPNARRPDLDPCLHRLVELSDRPRPEQHHGLRAMTSSPAFRRFAFAFGSAFAVLYVVALKLDLALFTVYPVARHRASGHAPFARHRRSRRWEFLAPRCIGTAGPRRPRSEHSSSALSPRSCPSGGRDGSGRGGCG